MSTKAKQPATSKPAVIAPPDYWEKACADLMKQDRILRKIIPKYTQVEFLTTRGDPFQTLARAIVGQQISVKAAQAVWDRVVATQKKFTAGNILKTEPTQFREAGMSVRKVEYLRDLANHFENGGLGHANWDKLDDETIIKELVAIRGIGRWTAEMFLMFHLRRPNVLPLDDLGLIKGISLAYFSGEPVSRSEAKEVAANWEPWKTVATWYMWRSIDPIPVEY